MSDFTKNDETLRQQEANLVGVDTIESLVNKETNEKPAVPGSIVTFELEDHEDNEKDIYTLKLVDHPKRSDDEVSIYSPIGQNIFNSHIGEYKKYTFNNRNFTIKILEIKTAV